MADVDDFSGIDQLTRGDVAQARRLRATLAVISRRTEDPELRQLVRSVLAGRESVRRVFAHASFWQMAETSFDNLQRGLDQLSPEERDLVAEETGSAQTADAEIDQLREPAADPGEGPGREDRGPHRWG
ncbi:hypothetical protein I601_1126 [Nocardioides dokdonensis FR1436]|uniref:Uncharacterized protein n=1 Tax=Nocardioides dokdonensis FR1436 TaxID=1300347 RepID=A0A1A9GH07_9ACTN|nr:hypothetical protein [Nocardioides dokdonensis]ANH37568.1 hypothetical protein I601_1126 [Nocardioides dokdonensis FR1436]